MTARLQKCWTIVLASLMTVPVAGLVGGYELSPIGSATEALASPGEVQQIPIPSSLLPSDGAAGGRSGASDLNLFPQNPGYTFARRLLTNPGASPEQIASYLEALFRELGYPTPATSSGTDAIDENATLSFTHPLGDIDGDQIDDIGFDVFCVDADVCSEPLGVENTLYPVCQWRHWFEARSGATGELIWKRKLDTPYPLPVWRLGCSVEFVIGTSPTPEGWRNVLFYQWQFMVVGVGFALHHKTYMLNSKTHEELWADEEDGICTTVGRSCKNFVVRPLLYTPPIQGNPLLPSKTNQSIFLRGIGVILWNVRDCTACLSPYLLDPVWDNYRPLEWAAALDPATGERLWRTDTFQPDTDRSLFPDTFPRTWIPMFDWMEEKCCYDLTGDGTPDLFFTTVAWDSLQAARGVVGPDVWDSHLVAFDGKTGSKLYTVEVVKDYKSDVYIPLRVVALGDVNRDGASDLLHVQASVNWTDTGTGFKDLGIVARTYSGQDGKLLWSLESQQLLDFLVLGDADGDGGNDFLIAYYETSLRNLGGSLSNVTDTRLAVHSGATGDLIWETTTMAAALDLSNMFHNGRLNGLFDFNGDGVSEVWLDRPRQFDDLTLLHNTTFLSGRDGSSLFTVQSVGAFAYPVGAKDLDGDGGNDFTITQGDIADMWLTASSGRTGEPLWSRRVMAIPNSGSLRSNLALQYHSLELDGNQSTADLLLTFLAIVDTTGGGGAVRSFYQQHQAIQGDPGRIRWGIPHVEELDISLHIDLPTPGTCNYLNCESDAASLIDSSSLNPRIPVLMGVSLVASLGIGFLVVRRRFKR